VSALEALLRAQVEPVLWGQSPGGIYTLDQAFKVAERIDLARALSEGVLAEGRRQTPPRKDVQGGDSHGGDGGAGRHSGVLSVWRPCSSCTGVSDQPRRGVYRLREDRAHGGDLLEQKWAASTGVGGLQRWHRSWEGAGPGYAAVAASTDGPVGKAACRADGKGPWHVDGHWRRPNSGSNGRRCRRCGGDQVESVYGLVGLLCAQLGIARGALLAEGGEKWSSAQHGWVVCR
jgi:hypothetical protein